MKNLIKPTAIFLTALILTFSGVSYFKTQPSVGIALPQAVGVFETSLQTGITSTATTMTLTANSIRGGGSLSGFNCVSVDEGSSNAEVICGTVSGTTVSGLTRGISYEDGETEVAGNKYSHRRGASIKITDFPVIQRLKAQNNGDSTFVNQLSYESYLTPTDDADIISKKYADDLAIAGSPDASLTVKGLVEIATQAGMASTSVAGTGDTTAWLALSATYATSTPTIRGLYVPVSENDGYLSQLWTRLSDAYTWTGAHIFSSTVNINGNFTSSATSTMATTTIADLTVSGASSFTGTATMGTVTSTTFTNSGTASTTDLVISGTCTNCNTQYQGTDSTPADTTTDTNTQTIGFRPKLIYFSVSAQDITPDVRRTHGVWTSTGYNMADSDGVLETTRLLTSNFTDSGINISVANVTDTGFNLVYTKSGIQNTTATVNYTATR